MTVVVKTYGDLIADDFLNVSRADAVFRELALGHDFVAYAPEWLVGEKAYPTSEFDGEIVAGSIDHETEKAYLLARDGAQSWFPKSAVRVYELAPDAEIDVPQNEVGGSGGEV